LAFDRGLFPPPPPPPPPGLGAAARAFAQLQALEAPRAPKASLKSSKCVEELRLAAAQEHELIAKRREELAAARIQKNRNEEYEVGSRKHSPAVLPQLLGIRLAAPCLEAAARIVVDGAAILAALRQRPLLAAGQSSLAAAAQPRQQHGPSSLQSRAHAGAA